MLHTERIHRPQMNNIKILQINTNRSRAALDMALKTSNELNISIIVISEPNRWAIENGNYWIHDDAQDTAIKILKNRSVKEKGSGTGYYYITVSNITIHSCYC